MRRYNREVFKETHDIGSTARYTSAEFNELLASRDVLIIQYRAVNITGTGPKLTIKLEGSDNGVDWVSLETIVNNASLTAGTINTGLGNNTVKVPAFARLAITMGGSASPSAEISIVVCGRDS